ncbi:MAG TPA: AraC family transcriptional regulator [Candidatus Limnocylindria bacterium]|jgi:AraC-like DNA-binding protein|nr:AraC family transcriptional regulator [Candidatus Limnocylindria bacterium]
MSIPSGTTPFAELFDFLEDVLAWVKDREGRYLWVNRALLLNYALEHPGGLERADEKQVLGKTDYELSPAFLADQFRLDDEQVLAGNRIVNRIERVGDSKGAATWNVTNKIPVYDTLGAIVGTAGITRPLNKLAPGTKASSDFGPVLAYMRDRYRHPITNGQLATVAKMSLRAFERQFLASFHLTPQKYLRKLRLGIASRALIYTTESLAELALSSGFGDQSHFTREFRRYFGRTPREYREHYKSEAAVFRTKSAASEQ